MPPNLAMTNTAIQQHKINQMIRIALAEESKIHDNGIVVDNDGHALVSVSQINEYAVDICNEVISELERAKVIEIHNDQ